MLSTQQYRFEGDDVWLVVAAVYTQWHRPGSNLGMTLSLHHRTSTPTTLSSCHGQLFSFITVVTLDIPHTTSRFSSSACRPSCKSIKHSPKSVSVGKGNYSIYGPKINTAPLRIPFISRPLHTSLTGAPAYDSPHLQSLLFSRRVSIDDDDGRSTSTSPST